MLKAANALSWQTECPMTAPVALSQLDNNFKAAKWRIL